MMTTFAPILLVDDEPQILKFAKLTLQGSGIQDVLTLEDSRQVMPLLATQDVAAIVLDLYMPLASGIELLPEITGNYPHIPVIVMTAADEAGVAVDCMKNGAFDYIIKPFSSEQIEVTLKKAEEFTQLLRVNRFLSQENEEAGWELLGQSAAMEDLRQLVRKVARTLATVLIQGESGTGKELVARALYRESSRANAPFIRVNCAAIPENLIESEFFGHEKGAFTGALTKREGRFELAHGGTILLDEISEIPSNLQAKLLRVLQEREFERVGGSRPALESFVAFRGREPQIDALLRHNGLVAA